MNKSDSNVTRPHRIDISGISRETQAKLALYRNLTGLTNAEILDKLLTDALPLLREREHGLSSWTDSPKERRMGDECGQMRADTRGAVRDDSALREQMARDAAAEDGLDRTDNRAA